ncbi:MAG: luciferase-like protein [Actinomycetia bacterium]|nr:luciferase-like protein [Actinomycetes bacterium]
MTAYGYTLFCEGNDPRDLVRAGIEAEAAGFEDLVISDHFHPWLPEHSHSPFAWSILGALAHATDRARLATMVTCPIVRYHPAVVAQMAATVGVMSDGRFTLGLGAGERLNEHVVGKGWPPVDVRHQMLDEAIDVIRALWRGGYVRHQGPHFTVEDARVFDLPAQDIDLFVAASGRQSAQLAVKAGGLCCTDPLGDLVQTFVGAGRDRTRTWSQIPLSWHEDEDQAVKLARQRFRFGMPGWKVMAELPNPVNFAAATQYVRDEDIAEKIPCGPDPERHAQGIRQYLDAGFEHVAVAYLGDDVPGFLRFWQDELRPRLG